jgi:3-oxoadipate enol-lactonase
VQLFDFVDVGVGEPVLFLHSMAGSRTSWQVQIERLSGRLRCLALDLPGYGGSAPLAPTTPMHHLADLTVAFLRSQLGLSSAHFVGLSVGGMLLQLVAVRHPAMVRSLTIMDSSPQFGFGGAADPGAFLESISAQLKSDTTTGPFCEAMVRAIMAPGAAESAYAAAVADMRRGTAEGFALCAHLIAGHDARAILPGIAAPTLVMVGERDRETPISYATALADRIPNAELHVIPHAGHLANIENPGDVNERLWSFLSLHAEAKETR